MYNRNVLLYSAGRSEALAAGQLVDCSALAQEAGFCWPVAVTASVWAAIQDIPARDQGMQDLDDRVWDVLSTAAMAVARDRDTTECRFRVRLPHSGGTTVALTLQVHPDDRGNPTVTIMLPYEQ